MIHESDKYYYKIVEVDSLFLGLNLRAVEYLRLHGDWYFLSDYSVFKEEYGYDGDHGLFLVSTKKKEEEQDIDNIDFYLAGSVWENKLLPTFVYDWCHLIPENKNIDEIEGLPLYKYRLNSKDRKERWIYEIKDEKSSKLYPNLQLFCLKDDENNIICPWEQKEVELSELLVEYEFGVE